MNALSSRATFVHKRLRPIFWAHNGSAYRTRSWGGDDAPVSLDEIRARYSSRILAANGVHAYFALMREQPIGWAQWYVALGAGGFATRDASSRRTVRRC